MHSTLFLVVFTTVALAQLFHSVLGLSCVPCETVDCRPTPKCAYGLVKDVCACCDVCAKGPEESCGGPWGIRGRCGKGMSCKANDEPVPFMAEGTCVLNKNATVQGVKNENEVQKSEGRKILRKPIWYPQSSSESDRQREAKQKNLPNESIEFIPLPKKGLQMIGDGRAPQQPRHEAAPRKLVPRRFHYDSTNDESNTRLHKPSRKLYIH